MSLGTIAPVVRAILLFIALIFCCVGAGTKAFEANKNKYYLNKVKQPGQDAKKYKDLPKTSICDELKSKWDAALAFAILGCIFIGFALVAVALQFAMASAAKALKAVSFGVSFLAFIWALISWAVVAGIYNKKQCNYAQSFKDGVDAGLKEGFALILVAWILLFFDLVFGVLALAAPSA